MFICGMIQKVKCINCGDKNAEQKIENTSCNGLHSVVCCDECGFMMETDVNFTKDKKTLEKIKKEKLLMK